MDLSFIKTFVGKPCKIILVNNFWYKGILREIKEGTLIFTDVKGRTIMISHEAVVLIEGVEFG